MFMSDGAIAYNIHWCIRTHFIAHFNGIAILFRNQVLIAFQMEMSSTIKVQDSIENEYPKPWHFA